MFIDELAEPVRKRPDEEPEAERAESERDEPDKAAPPPADAQQVGAKLGLAMLSPSVAVRAEDVTALRCRTMDTDHGPMSICDVWLHGTGSTPVLVIQGAGIEELIRRLAAPSVVSDAPIEVDVAVATAASATARVGSEASSDAQRAERESRRLSDYP